MSKTSKRPSLKPLALKNEIFCDGLNFKRIKKICIEKVAGEQGLALQQLFPYKFSYFFGNSNHHKISFFNARDFKLCHFGIFDMLFPFLAFFKL